MSKVEKIISEYKKSRVETKRLYYPRKLDLHPKFVKVLELQINKLRKDGMNDEQIIRHLTKAIPFHVQSEE